MNNFTILGVPSLKEGSKIQIKKENRGKFTDYCGGEVTQKCIDKAKQSENKKLVKRATFAENAKTWKHQQGGQLHKNVYKCQRGMTISVAAPGLAMPNTAAVFKDAFKDSELLGWGKTGWNILKGMRSKKNEKEIPQQPVIYPEAQEYFESQYTFRPEVLQSTVSDPLQFRSDTIWTPNIRTKNSESYKKGHSTRNSSEAVVLHHTGHTERSLKPVTTMLANENYGNSAHVVIGEDGNRVVMATPDQVTFHSGASRYRNRNNVNDFAIGVEFQGDTDRRDLTPKQIQSFIEYIKPYLVKNNIPLESILSHANVRDAYNKYMKSQGQSGAAPKRDINERNMEMVRQELLKQVYQKK